MTRYKGVLVIGRERSGTKFLTNLIAANFGLAAIQSEEHDGVLETNLVAKYEGILGNPPRGENLKALKILFQHDAFFRHSHVSKDQLESLEFESAEELLWKFLNLEAETCSRPGWVQKVSSRFLWKYEGVPALKVIIQRRIPDNIFSHSKLVGDESLKFVIRDAIATVSYAKLENYFSRRNKIRKIKYEDLKLNPKEVINPIYTEFFGKELEEFVPISYNNSSFRQAKSKPKIPTRIRLISFVFRMLFYLIPDYFFHLVISKYSSIRRPKQFMPKTFLE